MKLKPEDIKPGMRITISSNKTIKDRSYTDEILVVAAVNAGHVQVKFTKARYGREGTILQLAEHDFFDASSFEIEEEDVERVHSS